MLNLLKIFLIDNLTFLLCSILVIYQIIKLKLCIVYSDSKGIIRIFFRKQSDDISLYKSKFKYLLVRYLIPDLLFYLMISNKLVFNILPADLVQSILVVLAIMISVLFGLQSDLLNISSRSNELSNDSNKKIKEYIDSISGILYISIKDTIMCIFIALLSDMKFNIILEFDLTIIISGVLLFYFSRVLISILMIANDLKEINSITINY